MYFVFYIVHSQLHTMFSNRKKIGDLAKKKGNISGRYSVARDIAYSAKKVFKHSHTKIQIFLMDSCSFLNEHVDFLEGLEEALQKMISLSILLPSNFQEKDEPKFFNRLRFFSIINGHDTISVKVASNNIVQPYGKKQTPVSFITGDEDMYWVVEDLNEGQACTVNFNDPKQTSVYAQLFDSVFLSKESTKFELFRK